ncbi:hypothetical protein CYMTET_15164, partial [Cymbomonas tetramitiformis]
GALLGSIICKLLCVVGFSFLLGGFRYKEQSYSENTVHTCMNVLLLASACVLLPSTVAYIDLPAIQAIYLSRYIAIIVACTYPLYLWFQLHTHKSLFQREEFEDEVEGKVEPMSFKSLVLLVVFLTYLIGECSDALIDGIEPLTMRFGFSQLFVGLVLLPLVNSIGELIQGVKLALKNEMDLSLTVTIGSCLQTALFMIPLMVLLGWALNVPVTLAFPGAQAISFILSVLVVQAVTSDRKSNWFEGVLLLTLYGTICFLFLYCL